MKKCNFITTVNVPTWEELYSASHIMIRHESDGKTQFFGTRKSEKNGLITKENDRLIFTLCNTQAILTKEQWELFMSGDKAKSILEFRVSNMFGVFCMHFAIDMVYFNEIDCWCNPFS